MVNHTSEGTHLVRVRSRNRLDHRVFRRCSYGESMTLCSQKWRDEYASYTEKKRKGNLRCERSNSNNNENQVMINDKDFNKVDTDMDSDDNNINININIHLHK